jgi:thiol-disulfide isomerase/thioredoxin
LIKFDPTYHIIDKKGYGFMKLIDNHNNTVNYDGNSYEIIYPKQFFVRDTAIGFSYYTGWENASIKSATAFLWGNYTSYSPILYVDYNNNLDFSDDGLPLKFKSDSTLVVYLPNSSNSNAFYPIKLYYPKLSLDQKQQLESIFVSMGADIEGNNIVSIDHWLGVQRSNYKIADAWLNGKNIKVGLLDYDCNGLYNDEDQDRILIGNYETDIIQDKLDKGAIIYKKNAQIPVAGTVYEVVEIDVIGKYIKLIKSNKTYLKPVAVGDNIDDLEIELITGNVLRINELQVEEKHLLLDFWGSWCKGCTQQLPNLKKLALKYSDKLQIVGLNYGDNFSAINKYISKNNILWQNGIANEEIMKQLRIDNFPNYLLLDSKGKIIIMNGTLAEIEEKL